MSYFRKFGSFCAGLTCFIMSIYLFRTFMTFEPEAEDAGAVDKLKEFLSLDINYGNRLAAVLVIMLVLCVASGVLLKRLPFVCPVFSLPPLLLTVDMVRDGYIVDYPILCVLLLCIEFVSCVFECVRLDKADGKRRAAWCADIATVGFAAFLMRLYSLGKMYEKTDYPMYDESGAEILISRFDSELLSTEPTDLKIFIALAAVYAVAVLVSLLLPDIYFIGGVLALPPAAFTAYLWSAEKITFHEEIIVAFAFAVLVARVIPAFSGTAKIDSKKAAA